MTEKKSSQYSTKRIDNQNVKLLKTVTMVINFICRASKTRKSGLTPIEMSIIIDGERGVVTLDRQIPLSKWIPKTQSVRGDKDINEYLNVIRRKCWLTYLFQMKDYHQ